MVIYAVTNGHLDDVGVDGIRGWERDFLTYMRSSQPEIGKAIRTKRQLDDELKAALEQAIRSFKALR